MSGFLIGPSGIAAASSGYVGPGDIVSSALAFWSLRAYSAAKAAAAVNCIDITDITQAKHSTLVVQTDGDLNVTSIASGDMAGSTLAAWIVAFGQAYVTKVYDQIGTRHATASSFGQKLTLNLYGTRPGINMDQTGIYFAGTGAITQSQPFTITSISKRTAAAGAGNILSTSGFSIQAGYSGSANNLNLDMGGGGTNTSCSDGTGHAVQWICNGASSILNIDGTDNAVTAGTNNISAETFNIGFGSTFTGDMEEVGFWSGATSSGNYLALQANQKTYWGTP